MNKRLQTLFVAAVLLGGAASADPAKTLYRWTDADGHVHYSDRVPPEAAHQQHEQIDARGNTTKMIGREKTPEEYASEQKKKREDDQREQEDRYLLQTYQSPEDLERAREAQLKILDERAAVTQKTLTNTEITLADLHSRKIDADSDEPNAKAKLQQQIVSFEATRRETAEALEKLKLDRQRVQDRFDSDLLRYQALRSGVATTTQPPKSP